LGYILLLLSSVIYDDDEVDAVSCLSITGDHLDVCLVQLVVCQPVCHTLGRILTRAGVLRRRQRLIGSTPPVISHCP